MSGIKNAILVGYSGHGLVVCEAALQSGYVVESYFDLKRVEFNPYELEYLGREDVYDLSSISNDTLILLGVGDNLIRLGVAEYLLIKGFKFPSIYHPDSFVSNNAKIASGVFIARGACINPFATIDEFSIINTNACVDHEDFIGRGAHIGPGAVLSGNVTVKDKAFVGANAVIKQGVTIGENAIIGAGSVVLKDVPDGEVWFGNPAKPKSIK